MLRVKNLRVYHGIIEAVHGINIEVPLGKCVALLGPNGAGKTSTISAITGVAKSEGSIFFEEKNLSSLSVEDRIKEGISVSPEGRRVFTNLTVEENLVLGGALKPKGRPDRIAGWFEIFPILGERKAQSAGTLSGGEQQMLAIARALMSEPKILLLDEPSLGLAPKIASQIFEMIKKLKQESTTILLVEQNATQALKLSDYAYFLNNGHILAEGKPEELGGREDLMAELTGIT
jgi:branched-chain amino acid transport system ATP-binding protein